MSHFRHKYAYLRIRLSCVLHASTQVNAVFEKYTATDELFLYGDIVGDDMLF